MDAGPILDPDRGLMMQHLPAAVRPSVASLFALDETLARILQTTSQPLIGQMRLTWWHEALAGLDRASPPAEPVLVALAASGLDGGALTPIVEGWEALLDDRLDDDAMTRHAVRGATLFAQVALLLDGPASAGPDVAAAGRAWALADLSRHLSQGSEATRARALAREALADAPRRWPRRLRPLGTLAALARHDAARSTVEERGTPWRALMMLAHRLTGR